MSPGEALEYPIGEKQTLEEKILAYISVHSELLDKLILLEREGHALLTQRNEVEDKWTLMNDGELTSVDAGGDTISQLHKKIEELTDEEEKVWQKTLELMEAFSDKMQNEGIISSPIDRHELIGIITNKSPKMKEEYASWTQKKI